MTPARRPAAAPRFSDPLTVALSLAGFVLFWWVLALLKADPRVLPAPPEVVADLASHAFLYGIIISPSTDELPDFVASLARHQVVSPEIFASRQGRQRRALDIVSDAARRPGGRGRSGVGP